MKWNPQRTRRHFNFGNHQRTINKQQNLGRPPVEADSALRIFYYFHSYPSKLPLKLLAMTQPTNDVSSSGSRQRGSGAKAAWADQVFKFSTPRAPKPPKSPTPKRKSKKKKQLEFSMWDPHRSPTRTRRLSVPSSTCLSFDGVSVRKTITLNSLERERGLRSSESRLSLPTTLIDPPLCTSLADSPYHSTCSGYGSSSSSSFYSSEESQSLKLSPSPISLKDSLAWFLESFDGNEEEEEEKNDMQMAQLKQNAFPRSSMTHSILSNVEPKSEAEEFPRENTKKLIHQKYICDELISTCIGNQLSPHYFSSSLPQMNRDRDPVPRVSSLFSLGDGAPYSISFQGPDGVDFRAQPLPPYVRPYNPNETTFVPVLGSAAISPVSTIASSANVSQNLTFSLLLSLCLSK